MKPNVFAALADKQPQFFLGANSGEGFCNYFGEIYRPREGDRLYILKGGPGTGKSTFMKELAVWMHQQGQPCELYFCSSDPRSLDGVLFPQIGTGIVDGTAPHVMEANYLGASERIVNLGGCLDLDALERQRKEILPIYEQNARLHKRAARFLNAASQLVDDSFAADCECSDLEKAEETALRLCQTLLTPKGRRGNETKRFLSGITPDGLVLFETTLTKFADKILAVEDEYGGAASVIMSTIRQFALEAGYDIITCPCALSPQRKIDHIIVPELGLAFCTANWLLPITVDTQRRIHARRFRDVTKLAQKKQRLRFNRRAVEELLDGACHYIHDARSVHDLLEEYYITAMDFEAADACRLQIQQELVKRMETFES